MAISQSKKPAAAADNSDLEKKVASLQQELAALQKKCAGLEKEVKECKACCDGKSSAPAGDGSNVSLREFRNWQKKVAKRLGFRL